MHAYILPYVQPPSDSGDGKDVSSDAWNVSSALVPDTMQQVGLWMAVSVLEMAVRATWGTSSVALRVLQPLVSVGREVADIVRRHPAYGTLRKGIPAQACVHDHDR